MPARASRRTAAEPVEERPGSGQSPASLARDLAAQPALLAGIAKKAPIHGGKRVSKATYSFTRAAAAQGSSNKAGRRGAAKKTKARLEFVRATYQKGNSAGNLTGAVYMRGVPSYGCNEIYKEKVNAKLLTETLRFNTELKVYTAKVSSPEQAIFVREAAKMACEADEVSPLCCCAPQSALRGACLRTHACTRRRLTRAARSRALCACATAENPQRGRPHRRGHLQHFRFSRAQVARHRQGALRPRRRAGHRLRRRDLPLQGRHQGD